ncbi:O-antigen polymerase [Massilimicrobiota timonensis]|uniref:O-antigen polymerase n=1 Tax=Massilimicrobiota timonensis TaxID=1776392 RepID=UPI00195F5E86|nr:O-antigen polymerase [Massilimicrobiota timonensis]MBM6966295.1 oligosaccharide repeat unit polymerase [Massilimicrobiota timonensis]
MKLRILNKKFNIELIYGFFAYILYTIIYYVICDIKNVPEIFIWFISFLGIIELIYIFYSYKKYSGAYFSLYTISILLMYIFNFGQCIAWAFGIHIEGEIGTTILFRYMVPNNTDILKSQLVFLICVFLFHVANVSKIYDKGFAILNKSNKIDNYSIFLTSIILSCVAIPATIYYSITSFRQALVFGYGSLYYGDMANNVNEIIQILQYLFFPCLIGLLIGSNYKKPVVIFVYFTFIMYMVVNALYGDRGSWFYTLLIIIWMHHRYYKKINMKKFIIYIVIGIVLLQIISAIVTVRNTGLSLENVKNALVSSKENVLLNNIFELGSSMGVNCIVISDGVKYPVGNSYLLALIGSLTTRIPQFFGIEYITLTRWFSQIYLNISWGAGFTIVAESIVNFGILFGPLIFVVFGLVFRKILNTGYLNGLSPIHTVINISLAYFFMNMIRNTMHDFMRGVFFGIIPLIVSVIVIKSFLKKSLK